MRSFELCSFISNEEQFVENNKKRELLWNLPDSQL